MPELRRDPIIERWVIIATERGARPSDFKHPAAVVDSSRKCPFCPGNESATPPEILAYYNTERSPASVDLSGTGSPSPAPPSTAIPVGEHTMRGVGAGAPDSPKAEGKKNASGWTLRVVPNKYPALKMQKTLDVQSDGMYDCMNGMGAHEVIIETPSHTEQLDEMNSKRVEDVIRVYKERIIAFKKDLHIQYIMVFKNHGRAAGATLSHPHSQLIAMPIVPIRVKQEMAGAKTYYDSRKRCIFCDIIREEKLKAQRIVGENDSFLAIEPYASRFPFETWIVPKTHSGHFEEIRDNEVKNLALIMKSTLGKIRRFLNNPPFNFIIHAAPVHEPGIVYYHWHIEIMPKLSQIAGFEWGTGFYINTTPPELAARLLNRK